DASGDGERLLARALAAGRDHRDRAGHRTGEDADRDLPVGDGQDLSLVAGEHDLGGAGERRSREGHDRADRTTRRRERPHLRLDEEVGGAVAGSAPERRTRPTAEPPLTSVAGWPTLTPIQAGGSMAIRSVDDCLSIRDGRLWIEDSD